MTRAEPSLVAVARRTQLTTITGSDAISAMGYDVKHRMVVVQFKGGPIRYGYPHLTDQEISGLLAVLQDHKSLGHYIATVIKPNHDHERVQL